MSNQYQYQLSIRFLSKTVDLQFTLRLRIYLRDFQLFEMLSNKRVRYFFTSLMYAFSWTYSAWHKFIAHTYTHKPVQNFSFPRLILKPGANSKRMVFRLAFDRNLIESWNCYKWKPYEHSIWNWTAPMVFIYGYLIYQHFGWIQWQISSHSYCWELMTLNRYTLCTPLSAWHMFCLVFLYRIVNLYNNLIMNFQFIWSFLYAI